MRSASTRVLVTGASGFIGSHVVHRLERPPASRAAASAARALVRRTSDRSLLAGSRAEIAVGDVRDPASLVPAVAGVDVVIHLAATLDAADQPGFDAVNVGGTEALLAACVAAGVRRFVLVSSIAAAGPSRAGEPRAEDAPPAPVSCYGRSKLAAEGLVRAHGDRLPWTIVRPPIVYGPGGAAMRALFQALQAGVVIDVRGAPRLASFVDVRDLARGIVEAAFAPAADGEVLHLVGPDVAPVAEFQRRVVRALGRRPLTLALPTPALHVAAAAAELWKRASGRRFPFGRDKLHEALAPGWVMCGDKARRLLGFTGEIGFERGIPDSVADYRARGWLPLAGER